MVYSVTQDNNDSVFGQLDRRIRQLENGTLQRLITVLPSGQVHVNGPLSVGGGSEGGGGGAAAVVVSGAPADVGTVTGAAGADADSVWIDLSWVYPTDLFVPVGYFEIRYKKTTDASTEYQYLRAAGTEIRIDNLVPSTAYNLDVRSIATNGRPGAWVAQSGGTGTTVADTTAPAQVTGLAAAAAPGYQTIMLTWTANTESDLDHYDVQIDDTAVTYLSLVFDEAVDASVIVADNLVGTGTPGATNYYARVRAVDKSGNAGTWSANVGPITTNLVESAYIAELFAGKIKAGTIEASTIKLDKTAGAGESVIQSVDFVTGTSGWAINGDGDAEFQDVTVRGDIVADTFATGTTGARMEINSAGLNIMRFYATAGTKYGLIGSSAATAGSLVMISNANSGDAEANFPQISLTPGTGITLAPYAGDFVYITNNLDVAGTAQLDGAVTLDSTFQVDGVSTLTGGVATTLSVKDGSGTTVVTLTEAAAVTDVGQIKLWTGDTNAMGQIIWEAAGGSYTGDIQMDRYQNDFRIVRGASVDMTIDASGNAYNRGGTWGTISDPSVKRNIRAAGGRRTKLMALDVVDYELIDRPGTHRGLDAAAAAAVFPELVETTFADPAHPDGLLSVKTSQLIWELLIYVQELETRVSSLGA